MYAFIIAFKILPKSKWSANPNMPCINVRLPEMCSSTFCCPFLSVGVSFTLDVIILVWIFLMLLEYLFKNAFLGNSGNFIYFKIGLGFVSRSLQNFISYQCMPQTLMSSFYYKVTLQIVTERTIKSLKLLLKPMQYLLGKKYNCREINKSKSIFIWIFSLKNYQVINFHFFNMLIITIHFWHLGHCTAFQIYVWVCFHLIILYHIIFDTKI